MTATVREAHEERPALDDTEFLAIIDSIKDLAFRIIRDNPSIPSEASFAIKIFRAIVFLSILFRPI